MHLGVNMYALHSFSELAINELGKEQLSAFYLAGGVFSSLTSLFFRVLSKSPDMSLGAVSIYNIYLTNFDALVLNSSAWKLS